MVDEYRNNEFVRQNGGMNLTKHINVLSSLVKRALRYWKKGQVQLDTDEVRAYPMKPKHVLLPTCAN